jgi:hypothetical protein
LEGVRKKSEQLFFNTVHDYFPNNTQIKTGNDYISLRLSSTLLYWDLQRAYFISHFTPPSDVFSAVTGTQKKFAILSSALQRGKVRLFFTACCLHRLFTQSIT